MKMLSEETIKDMASNAANNVAFARLIEAAVREACAKLCDAKASVMWARWDARADLIDQGRALCAEELAEEIRS